MRDGFEGIDLIHACNYNSIRLENVAVSNFKGECIVKVWSDGDVIFDNVRCNASDKVKKSEEKFFSKAI